MSYLIKSIMEEIEDEYLDIFKRPAPPGVVEVVANRSLSDSDVPIIDHLLGVINVALLDYYEGE